MDEQLLNPLEKDIGNIEENMSNHKTQLKQKECFLLVAGRWINLSNLMTV